MVSLKVLYQKHQKGTAKDITGEYGFTDYTASLRSNWYQQYISPSRSAHKVTTERALANYRAA